MVAIDLPRGHFSNSQLTSYESCGHRYYRENIEEIRHPPQVFFPVGSGVHGGADYRHRVWLDVREEPPVEDVVDVAVAEYDDRCADGLTLLGEEDKAKGEAVVMDAGRDLTARYARAFMAHVAPLITDIKHTELAIDARVPKIGTTLTGRIDVVHVPAQGELGAPQGIQIADLKTGKRKPSQEDVDAGSQLTFYALLWRSHAGEWPASVGIHQLKEAKKDFGFSGVTSRRDEADVVRLLRRIKYAVEGIRSGRFAPAPDWAWWCSPSSCPHWGACKYRGA